MTTPPNVPILTAWLLSALMLLPFGCGSDAQRPPSADDAATTDELTDPALEPESEHELKTSDPVREHVPKGARLRIVLDEYGIDAPGSAHPGRAILEVYNGGASTRDVTVSGPGLDDDLVRNVPPGELYEFDLDLRPGTVTVSGGEGFEAEIDIAPVVRD